MSYNTSSLCLRTPQLVRNMRRKISKRFLPWLIATDTKTNAHAKLRKYQQYLRRFYLRCPCKFQNQERTAWRGIKAVLETIKTSTLETNSNGAGKVQHAESFAVVYTGLRGNVFGSLLSEHLAQQNSSFV